MTIETLAPSKATKTSIQVSSRIIMIFLHIAFIVFVLLLFNIGIGSGSY